MTLTPENVDEEINKQIVLLADLHAQKNSFLPIFRLLPEILEIIFTHGARDEYHQRDVYPFIPVPPIWVNISHVCRHWRNVALNSPTLWTYHCTVSPRWTEELLARSKQASLKIRIHFPSHKSRFWRSSLAEKVLNYAERIQELRLDIPTPLLPTDFLSSEAFGISPKVSLPCLAHFSVDAPLSTVVALLSCINIPLGTRVGLVTKSDKNSSTDDYGRLASVLAQRFNQSEDLTSSSPTIRSLAVSFRGYYGSKFAACASERDDCNSDPWPPQDCNPPLIICIRSDEYRDRIMSDICCCIPSTHVQTLHVIDPPATPEFWRRTLGHLDGLRWMKLSNGLMPNLASLLAAKPVEAPGADNGHDTILVAPALEELELYDMLVAPDGCSNGTFMSEKALLDALSTRKVLRPQVTATRCTVSDLLPFFYE